MMRVKEEIKENKRGNKRGDKRGDKRRKEGERLSEKNRGELDTQYKIDKGYSRPQQGNDSMLLASRSCVTPSLSNVK